MFRMCAWDSAEDVFSSPNTILPGPPSGWSQCRMTGGDAAFESTMTVFAAKGWIATEPPQQNEASALAPVTLNRRFSRTLPSSCAWRDEVEPLWPHCSMPATPSQDLIALMNSSSFVVRASLQYI